MKLTPPTQVVFFISLVIAIIGVLAFTGTVSIGIEAFWIMAVAYVLLALGNLLENL